MTDSYVGIALEVLDEVEAVRKRPGMYVGSGGPLGVAHLVFGLVASAVERHWAGQVTELAVQLGAPGLSVTDDGPGWDVDTFARAARIGFPAHPTVHHSSDGIDHGVALALSSTAVITSDGARRLEQVFVRGQPVTEVLDVGPAVGRGTAVRLVPDAAVFQPARVPAELVRRRLEELAMLNPALALTLDGVVVPSLGGVRGYARWLAGDVRRELVARGTFDGVDVELAVAWGDGEGRTVGYVNQLECEGAHLHGLLDGLGSTDERGRVAVLAVRLADATFDGRTRRVVRGKHLRDVVRDVVRFVAAPPRDGPGR